MYKDGKRKDSESSKSTPKVETLSDACKITREIGRQIKVHQIRKDCVTKQRNRKVEAVDSMCHCTIAIGLTPSDKVSTWVLFAEI